MVECGSDDGVNLEHSLRGEPGSVATGGDAEVVVEPVEMVGTQPSQRDVAEVGWMYRSTNQAYR